jgi:hypothetical protein
MHQLICTFLLVFSLMTSTAWAQAPEADPETDEYCLPHNAVKYQTLFRQVFLPICRTNNIVNKSLFLHIYKKGETHPVYLGAWYLPENGHHIYIQEETYDMCRTFAADSLNALAFFIGHELGHYLQGQSGGAACSAFHLDDVTDPTKVERESNADIEGLLLARIAGFKTLKIQDLMQHFYKAFELIDRPDYPTKADRIAFFRADSIKAQQSFALFSSALHLLCANESEYAITALEHLYTTEKLIAPEIANNLITAYLQRIQTSLQKGGTFNYRIPLALDSHCTTRTNDDDDQNKRRLLLNRLDAILQNALTQMPNDTSLTINRALHTILYQWNENGETVDTEDLIAVFNKTPNLQRYGKILPKTEIKSIKRVCDKDEKIFDAVSSPSLGANIRLQQTEKEWLIAIKSDLDYYTIKGTDGGNTTDTTVCGIHIGSTVYDLKNAYGNGLVIKALQHDLYLYNNGLLCFYVQNDVVVNWSLLRI